MVKSILRSTGCVLVSGFLAFFVHCAQAEDLSILNALWDAAVRAETVQVPAERVRLFSDWIEKAQAQSIRSAEAHYHLAMAYWANKDTGKAVYHLIESAKLRQSPLGALKLLGKVNQIESEQSVREGLSSSLKLQLFFFLTPNLCFSFALIALWSVILALFFWWQRGRRVEALQVGLFIFAAFCSLFPLSGLIAHSLVARPIAVTDVPAGTFVGVYQGPEIKDETKIINLPSGILVMTDEEKNGWSRISQPLAGWVESRGLRAILLRDR